MAIVSRTWDWDSVRPSDDIPENRLVNAAPVAAAVNCRGRFRKEETRHGRERKEREILLDCRLIISVVLQAI